MKRDFRKIYWIVAIIWGVVASVCAVVYAIKFDKSKFVPIKIEKKYAVDKQAFYKFVKTAFSMRRKTLFNNLALAFSKEKLKQTFDEEFLRRRAESLTIDEFVEAYKKLNCKE